jgi:hypothetical protein
MDPEIYGAGSGEGVAGESLPPLLTDTELHSIVRAEIDDAVSFIDQEIGHQRARSLEYYRGDSIGNEEEGRSQIVSREVRDAVQSVLPSLMRVFFGSQRPVEFVPTAPEDVAVAEQATDYVNHVVMQENPGFEVFYSVFKDSLMQKAGIVKYWLDESAEVDYHQFTDLSDEQLALLLSEEGAEIAEIQSTPEEEALAVALQMGVEPPQRHNALIKRTVRAPRVRIQAVPPEEFLIDRRARSIDDSRMVAHRSLVRFSDLVALGYEPEFLRRHISNSDVLEDTHEVWTRYDKQGGYWPGDSKNPDEQRILYVETYIRIDWDGDGLAELRKICTVGDSYEIVANEPCSDRPFAAFCPDPEAHLFFGEDLADQTKDLQEIITSVKRNVLDSLAMSIHPRTAVVEGMADINDVLNTEVGAIMRQQAPGMITPFTMPFVGREALPILEMLEAERDKRVGTHNLALEADALQSTTKAAVNAQVDAARQRLELIARIYAEVGMKRLFKGLLRLLVQHQDQVKMVRLRNEFVPIDPSVWNANMDVTINCGLGNGLEEDRIAILQQTLQVQREVLTQMGMSNPLVGLGHVRNTLAKLLEMSGYKDSSQFFKSVPLDFEPPPPPEPKPEPAELLAQVEMQKIQSDMLMDGERLKLDWAKLELEVEEAELKYSQAIDVAGIKAMVEERKLGRVPN